MIKDGCYPKRETGFTEEIETGLWTSVYVDIKLTNEGDPSVKIEVSN